MNSGLISYTLENENGYKHRHIHPRHRREDVAAIMRERERGKTVYFAV